ncbi:MAG: adaptor protein MecA [Clostridia bacterium]
MKVEKLTENKIRITLTFDELKKRKISLSDLQSDSLVAKDLFIDLLEESNLEEDFSLDDAQLFIEASADSNNLFIVTITKVENIPELQKYSLIENTIPKKVSKKKKIRTNYDKKIDYKVDSFVYSFSSIDDILDMCNVAKSEKLFFGKNSLYKYIDTYFLVFSKSSIKNKKFIKTFVFLSEFCKQYYSYDIFGISIKEKSKLIIEDKALQKLTKI